MPVVPLSRPKRNAQQSQSQVIQPQLPPVKPEFELMAAAQMHSEGRLMQSQTENQNAQHIGN